MDIKEKTMNVILYTEDFEPIIPIDLPLWLLERLEQEGAVRVAVNKPRGVKGDKIPVGMVGNEDMPTVRIRYEKLRWHDGSLKTILVTPDEELALTLTPEWLPGQRAPIQLYLETVRKMHDELIRQIRKNQS
jgi:hypothetical protein